MLVLTQNIERVSMTPNGLFLIERMGRLCYGSGDKMKCDCDPESRCDACYDRAEKFALRIVKNEHLSVLRHASMSYILLTDRGISHELVRHQAGVNFSQESTRYCCYADGIAVIADEYTDDAWCTAVRAAETSYLYKLQSGQKPQHARSVLPTCLATRIGVTANMQAWRHMFKMRMSPAAHPQIRRLMALVLVDMMGSELSVIVEDFEPLALEILG